MPWGLKRFHQSRQLRFITLNCLLFALSRFEVAADATPDPFDAPLGQKVVDFGPSPYYPGSNNMRNTLSCFVYPDFMVKMYDEGEKGAEWMSVVPVEKEATPECSKSHTQREWVLDGKKEWFGYFLGVKGNLVFFVAADGTDGGMPFAIFDAKTRKKIFEDSYFDGEMWNEKFEDSPFNHMRVERAEDGQLWLKYLRVKGTLCDLHPPKAACWEATRKKLGIKTPQKPDCIDYEENNSGYPSAVGYPVEVSLFPKPITKTIDGPVRCWPVD